VLQKRTPRGSPPSLSFCRRIGVTTVDGDHICRYTDQLGDPGNDVALEFRGVERRENVAELGRLPEWQEPAEKFDLLLAKPCDINDGFCPCKRSEQVPQKDLSERIDQLCHAAADLENR
jgi:hypothetical protein